MSYRHKVCLSYTQIHLFVVNTFNNTYTSLHTIIGLSECQLVLFVLHTAGTALLHSSFSFRLHTTAAARFASYHGVIPSRGFIIDT